MPAAPDSSSVELAERLGAVACVATVSRVERLSTSVVAVTLSSDQARTLAGRPGNDVMVRLVDDAGRHVRRRYSVREVADGSLVLWVGTSHAGPGAKWATSVAVGDEVDVLGPRGKIGLDEMADWHLFVGDVTALAAFFRIAESIEAPGSALFVVEVDNMADALTPALPEGIAPTGVFVERGDRRLGDPAALLSALAVLDLPEGEGHAYVFGELATSRAVVDSLVDRGLAPEQVDLKAYWRAGRANQEHGEPAKEP